MKSNLFLVRVLFIAAFTVIIGTAAADSPASRTGVSGLWHGTFDINGRGNFNLYILQVGDRMVGISEDAKVAYRGTAQLNGDNYSATYELYFINRHRFETATITGTFAGSERGAKTIDARFVTKDAGDKGALKFSYLRDRYERPTPLAGLVGPWILYRGYRIITLNIAADGDVSGGDTDGCGFKGRVTAPDESRNAFEVALLVSSCDRMEGEFRGMAWLDSSLEEDDTLNVHVFEHASKDSWSIFMPLVRNKDTKLLDDGEKPR